MLNFKRILEVVAFSYLLRRVTTKTKTFSMNLDFIHKVAKSMFKLGKTSLRAHHFSSTLQRKLTTVQLTLIDINLQWLKQERGSREGWMMKSREI
jgi:DNA/RNA endonuclease G (NUC1)